MTMVNHSQPGAARHIGFSELGLYLLDMLIRDKADAGKHAKSLGDYSIKLARLGYLARAHDPPPGNKVMWRGLIRLTDIELKACPDAYLPTALASVPLRSAPQKSVFSSRQIPPSLGNRFCRKLTFTVCQKSGSRSREPLKSVSLELRMERPEELKQNI